MLRLCLQATTLTKYLHLNSEIIEYGAVCTGRYTTTLRSIQFCGLQLNASMLCTFPAAYKLKITQNFVKDSRNIPRSGRCCPILWISPKDWLPSSGCRVWIKKNVNLTQEKYTEKLCKHKQKRFQILSSPGQHFKQLRAIAGRLPAKDSWPCKTRSSRFRNRDMCPVSQDSLQ